MKLYDRYPTSVEVNGKRYPIETDFRPWINFHDLALQSGNDEQRIKEMLALYEDGIPYDLNAAISALCNFYAAGNMRQDDDSKPVKPVYDFDFDGDYFIAGFRENYGISLLSIDYLHWWEFLALFRGMNADTELKQRMQLRSIDISKISDIKEKARIRRAQLSIAIPAGEMADEDIGDALSSIF